MRGVINARAPTALVKRHFLAGTFLQAHFSNPEFGLYCQLLGKRWMEKGKFCFLGAVKLIGGNTVLWLKHKTGNQVIGVLLMEFLIAV